MDFEEILTKQYREPEGISDESLAEEAICSAEGLFDVMVKDPKQNDELMYHNRIMAYLYLALKAEQRKNRK